MNLRQHERPSDEEGAYGVLNTPVLQLLAEFGEVAFNFLCLHLNNLIVSVLIRSEQRAVYDTLFPLTGFSNYRVAKSIP